MPPTIGTREPAVPLQEADAGRGGGQELPVPDTGGAGGGGHRRSPQAGL